MTLALLIKNLTKHKLKKYDNIILIMDINYYPLINKFMSLINLKKSASHKDAPESSFIVPFITVAREPGSGGAPIAKRVSEKLGFELIDEQLVEEIAKSTKKRKEIISAIDEKSRGKLEDIVHNLLNTEYVDDYKYVSELAKLILTYAYKGRTVILGRGANFITPFGKGLHVNIIAPYEVRVQRAMDFEGHTRAVAKEIIAKVEKERTDFVKQYLKQDPTKAEAYDITINTNYYRVEEAADVVIEALRRKFGRSFPKLGIKI